MFLNPWRTDERSTFNVPAARRLLALLVMWRLVSYDWSQLADWPRFVIEAKLGGRLPMAFLHLLPWLPQVELVTLTMLGLVLTRRWWKWPAVVAAIGLVVLASFHQCVDNQGKRFLAPALCLILFAVFPPRQNAGRAPRPSENPLCWILLVLSLTYVLVVVHRIKGGYYLEWTNSANLLRTIRWDEAIDLGLTETFSSAFFHSHPALAGFVAHTTLIAEVSLLAATILRWRITIPALALIGMHLGILTALHLFFVGSIGMLLMFFDWERVFAFLGIRPVSPERETGNLHHAAMPEAPLVLYDGVCGLCNRSVAWVLKHDKTAKFHFAPLQGPTAQQYVGKLATNPDAWSMSLVDGKHIWHASDAALRIIAGTGGIWNSAALLLVIPRGLRDACYRWIAKRRYTLFGKSETCQLPPPEVAQRFLP